MIKENSKGSNEVPADAGQANGKNLLVNDQNKYRSMLIRAYSSIWMIGGFIFVVYMGNHYIWAMVVILQTFMIKELFGLLRKANEDKQLPAKASTGSSKPAVGPSATGPITEEEITAVLMHKAPVTTLDLVAKFKTRLRTKEDKNAFADILRRIAKIPKTNGPNYVVLRNK